MQQQQEEDFMAMLDDYIDEDEINQILEIDESGEYVSRKKNNHPTEAKFPDSMTVDIKDFVEHYLGITYAPAIETIDCYRYKHGKKVKVGSKTRINYDTLWHRGLKELQSPFVIGVDNDYANKNPDKVYGGELLLVIDARGNRGTYVNPEYIRQLIASEDIEFQLKKLRKTGITNLDLLEDYIRTCVELQLQYDTHKDQNKKTLEVLRDNNKMHKYKELRKELKKDA